MFFRTGSLVALTLSAVLFAFALSHPTATTISTVQAQAQEQTQASPSTGPSLFHEKGCEHCHGVGLQGTDKGPNLTGVGRRLSSAEIEHQIHDGDKEMPSFADALDPGELALLTDYLSQQKLKPHRQR